ncbi:hypothetical protein [Kitasatospora terrestris]|uniref:Gram-positive cocci surface proteins LPxTG domain-containing protein n=1 Tax=Kitasatospora terrestris TaxID=258051 RepID=A0ABP9EQL1_9ACTN
MQTRASGLVAAGLCSFALALGTGGTAQANTLPELTPASTFASAGAEQNQWFDEFAQSVVAGEAFDLPGFESSSAAEPAAEPAAEGMTVGAPTTETAPQAAQPLGGGSEHGEHGDKPGHGDHGDKPGHGEHGDKPGHGDHGDKPGHGEHGDKPGAGDQQNQGQGQGQNQGQNQGQGQEQNQGQAQGQDQNQGQAQGQNQNVVVTVVVENKIENKVENKLENHQSLHNSNHNSNGGQVHVSNVVSAHHHKGEHAGGKGGHAGGKGEHAGGHEGSHGKSDADYSRPSGGHSSDSLASAQAAKGELARTGTDELPLLLGAAALLGTGGVLVRLRRSRRA